MTTFLFVRHGETFLNTTPDIIGGHSVETPLTERGERQAQLLGDYLATHTAPDVVFSSGAVRTNRTAHLALKTARLNLPITEDPRLLELSQGVYEGTRRDLAYTPDNKALYSIGSFEGKFPEGESILEVQTRMKAFLLDIHAQYPTQTVIVFGHGFAIRTLAGALREFSVRQILDEATDNVSLTRITVEDGEATVHHVGKRIIQEPLS